MIEPTAMIAGFSLGLFLGTTSSLLGFLIRSVFRWMGA